MTQIEIPQGTRSNREQIKSVAESIEKGKGIPLLEVAAEIGADEKTIRTHAKSLGCYHVAYINGRPAAFITSL